MTPDAPPTYLGFSVALEGLPALAAQATRGGQAAEVVHSIFENNILARHADDTGDDRLRQIHDRWIQEVTAFWDAFERVRRAGAPDVSKEGVEVTVQARLLWAIVDGQALAELRRERDARAGQSAHAAPWFRTLRGFGDAPFALLVQLLLAPAAASETRMRQGERRRALWAAAGWGAALAAAMTGVRASWILAGRTYDATGDYGATTPWLIGFCVCLVVAIGARRQDWGPSSIIRFGGISVFGMLVVGPALAFLLGMLAVAWPVGIVVEDVLAVSASQVPVFSSLWTLSWAGIGALIRLRARPVSFWLLLLAVDLSLVLAALGFLDVMTP